MLYRQSMRKRWFVILLTLTGLLNWRLPAMPCTARADAATSAARAPEAALNATVSDTARARAAYGEMALRFERNEGQLDERVRFAARGVGYGLWLTDDGALLSLRSGALKAAVSGGEIDREKPSATAREAKTARLGMKLIKANPAVSVRGEEELPGRSNYLVGNDPSKWRSGVSNYAKVVYREVYRGVDLVYYGKGGELEYDFKVAAGANPAAIGWRIEGAKQLRIDAGGELVIGTAAGEVRQHKPVAYQEAGGKRRAVAARYVMRGKDQVSFALGRYDHGKPLVIDPALVYSTYLGGSHYDEGHAIAADAAGNAYITGYTLSDDFPTLGALQTHPVDDVDIFITKLNAAGTALVYSTYLGGNDFDSGNGIAVDSAGNVYVVGQTASTNFPTVNAIQTTRKGNSDAFVTKLNASGTALIYSTYLGGTAFDTAQSLAVEASGNACIVGQTTSNDFPLANPVQPTRKGAGDAFVTKLNPAGSAFIYSTYLGGGGSESQASVAVDSFGNAYVAGSTLSPDFPLVNALQLVFKGKTAFKTFDGGNNWAAINNNLPVHVGVNAMAVDPQTPSTLYAGTAGSGVYKSTDGGNAWSAASAGLPPNAQVLALAINPATPSTLFAGLASGIFRSTDAGASWSGEFGPSTGAVVIDPTNPANVYAGINSAMLKSTNGGQTWTSLPVRDVTQTPGFIHAMAIDPASPATLYAGGFGNVFKSANGGLSWQLNGIGMPFTNIYALLVDPTNPATVYAGADTGFYKSANGGANWSHSGGNALAFTRALILDPAAASTLYIGTYGKGIYKSTDSGDSWAAVRNGLRNSFITALAINPQNAMTVYAGAIAANDGFIAKLNATGSALIYSTYLGGDEPDFCSAIAVDAAGNVYVTGPTHSSDFPTVNPLRGYSGYTDAFVSKLNNSGTALVYSTHLGGSYEDQSTGIAVDSMGNAFVVGTTLSGDFPTVRPLQAAFDDPYGNVFVAKLTPSGNALAYSTYLGGGMSPFIQGLDQSYGIAVDAKGNAYVTGLTYSDDFPITPNAFQKTRRSSDGEAFVTKISDYDICMQDETNGNLLQVNSTSGDYRFANCRKGIVYAGKGTVTVQGCKTTLTARAADQTLTALINTCSRVASAELIAQGKSLTIIDKDTANNTCACK